MRNVLGTWRCVCDQDTAHIHVMVVANTILELTICNLHLLPRAAPAGMGILGRVTTNPKRSCGGRGLAMCLVMVRCVCEQDTEHLHAIIASIHVLELTIGNLLLLLRAVPAGTGILELQPIHTTGLEVAGEQCAWHVEVCVCV